MVTAKPYAEQTAEERAASLDRLMNVLVHPDWQEMYLRFSEEAADAQRQMDEAQNWETFVAARAVRLYIRDRILGLRDLVVAEQSVLAETESDVLQPTDYEVD